MAEQPKKKRTVRFDATGRWVLVATVSASSMAFIMQSALNVALPPIQDDLDATGADLVWIVNAFSSSRFPRPRAMASAQAASTSSASPAE